MKIYFRLLSFSKPYRHYVPEYAFFTFFAIIFGVINFTLIIPLLNVLFGMIKFEGDLMPPEFSFSPSYFLHLFNYQFNQLATSSGKFTALEFVCAVILGSVLLANFFRYMSQRVLTRMRVRIVMILRERIFQKFSELPLGFFHKQKKGDLLSVITSDVQEIENSIVSTIQVFFRDTFTIIVYFIVLFSYSVQLTLFSILFFPISGFIISTISRRLKKKSRDIQKMLGSTLSISEETLSGTRIIKGFSAEKFVNEKFRKENSVFARLAKSIVNQRELASPLTEVLSILVVVTLILYGGKLILDGGSQLSPSAFITYIVIYSQVLSPAKNISSAVTNMQRGLAAGERIFKILDTENNIVEKENAEEIKSFEKEIEYKNVSFKYDSTVVLKNVNLKIARGKIIALVGKSGSGKSTMTDLLPRFYDVEEGEILIDGKNIRDLKLNSLRGLMGIVSQEPILFNDTVFNNIAFGKENAKEEDVIRAAKIANAHEFILNLENGYQTYIGDRGSKLSGGERQRMTIARAVFKNPPVMILDEATSSLDTESEKLVQDALNNLMKDRTSIVIAHRLSTIQHADEIIVMQQGEIVERGNHQTLINVNGVYRKLVEMQQF